ncbi:MAG: MoaD/ThiS family protein [Thermoplasmata archaeon]|nr:MAG: MoaD/ThiS family protein [Thermoplasmata archaeon]
MIIKVKYIPNGKKENIEIKIKATGQDILDKLNLAPDAHIISKNGNPIPLDAELEDGENIEIIQVVSGG